MLKKIIKEGKQKIWLRNRESLRSKHELRYLFWECTLNCNFHCIHCGSSAGDRFEKDTVSTQEIKAAFKDVATNMDANRVMLAITGGEPLLRKDLFDVVTYATSLGFHWGMVTNGFLVTKEIVAKCIKASLSSVDVSIDGIGKIHDDFRNTKGAYERAMNAVKFFADTGKVPMLRISTTINKNNINELGRMYEVFSKSGAKYWRPIIVDPIGRALENKDICLSRAQITKLLNFVKEKRDSKSKLDTSLGCAHFFGDYEDEVRQGFFYCATGINIASILHNGDIYVCPNVPRRKEFVYGNIKKDSLSKIWNEKFDFFRQKERTSNEKCLNCKHWEECLGGSFHSWNMSTMEQKMCLMP